MTSMVSDTEDEIGIGLGPDTPNDVGGLPIVTCESASLTRLSSRTESLKPKDIRQMFDLLVERAQLADYVRNVIGRHAK